MQERNLKQMSAVENRGVETRNLRESLRQECAGFTGSLQKGCVLEGTSVCQADLEWNDSKTSP